MLKHKSVLICFLVVLFAVSCYADEAKNIYKFDSKYYATMRMGDLDKPGGFSPGKYTVC